MRKLTLFEFNNPTNSQKSLFSSRNMGLDVHPSEGVNCSKPLNQGSRSPIIHVPPFLGESYFAGDPYHTASFYFVNELAGSTFAKDWLGWLCRNLRVLISEELALNG